MIRDFRQDKLKSPAEMFKAQALKCASCDQSVTMYKGPGDQHLCRDHQINLTEYGGMGTVGVKHSHHRLRCCAQCNYTPETDPDIIAGARDKKHLNSIIRSLLEVDHIDGDHSNNDPENLRTLCPNCHRKKTMINGDTVKRQALTE